MPKSFGIAATAGPWEVDRDPSLNPPCWYTAEITAARKVGPGTVELTCTIPPNASETENVFTEIQIFAEDTEGEEFFLGFGQPGNPPHTLAPIAWSPGDVLNIRLQLVITPVAVDQVFIFKYSIAQEIDEHNLAENAHPELLKLLAKFGIYMFQSDNIYGGQWIDPYPSYSAVDLHDGDWVYLNEDGYYYKAIADGSIRGTTPGQMRITPDGTEYGQGRVIYGGLMEVDSVDIAQGGMLYLSSTVAGAVTGEATNKPLGASLGNHMFLISSGVSSGGGGGGYEPDRVTINLNSGNELMAVIATEGEEGHAGVVKPDGDTITIEEETGVISVAEAVRGVPLDESTIKTVNNVAVAQLATASAAGIVKPDNLTITNTNGDISARIATSSLTGVVKTDAKTTKVTTAGVLSAETMWPTNSFYRLAADLPWTWGTFATGEQYFEIDKDCYIMAYGTQATSGYANLHILVNDRVNDEPVQRVGDGTQIILDTQSLHAILYPSVTVAVRAGHQVRVIAYAAATTAAATPKVVVYQVLLEQNAPNPLNRMPSNYSPVGPAIPDIIIVNG
jgi:hypothetical protein